MYSKKHPMDYKAISFYFLLFSMTLSFSQTTIKDALTSHPVSYATVSFNNGNGLFANDEGEFVFTKKLYPDIDTLYISALGYKDLKVATENLSKILLMATDVNTLDEVLLTAKIDRKFKVEAIKPYLDDDYYNCWLPTIESEIAVYFNNPDDALKKITKVHFPITLESKDWEKRKRANAEKKPFSTLFKVKFYNNENGHPGKELSFQTIVFRATEKDGDKFTLDVSGKGIFMPQSGVFVSLQVLGYTDDKGKLLANKKYKEIKSNDGSIIKIPTNFRPLLPFTDKIAEHKTYVKRVFVNDNKWTQFEKGSNFQSTLLQSGHYNYGIGLTFNVYKD